MIETSVTKELTKELNVSYIPITRGVFRTLSNIKYGECFEIDNYYKA